MSAQVDTQITDADYYTHERLAAPRQLDRSLAAVSAGMIGFASVFVALVL